MRQNFAYKRATILRHIQFLIAIFNGFHKGPLILAIIAATIVISAFALPTIVRSSNLELIFLLFLIVAVIDCYLIIVVMLGQMASLYVKSGRVFHDIKWKTNSNVAVQTKKWEIRFYRSCAPLKILLGSGHFLDAFTPLGCLMYSMDLCVNALLLS